MTIDLSATRLCHDNTQICEGTTAVSDLPLVPTEVLSSYPYAPALIR
jgi:hypothetical protein